MEFFGFSGFLCQVWRLFRQFLIKASKVTAIVAGYGGDNFPISLIQKGLLSMLNNILRRFLASISGRTQPQRRPARRRSTRLNLEMLEDRVTPSTLTVTNNHDSGSGSLRNTIAAANSGDTINFASSVHSITLTSGELEIGKNLNIQGPGANNLTISGNNASRVFHIDSGETVTLANMKIANGLFSGPLPSSMVGTYSRAAGPARGAAAAFSTKPALICSLTNDKVTGNQAVHGSSSDAFTVLGGGLLNLGTATLSGCTFSNNQAEGGNGLDNIGGSAGGAIDNFGGPTGGATLTATSTTFSNNCAVAAGGGFFFGIGGAIESDAGLNSYDPTQAEPSTVTLVNCSVANNVATGGPNALGNGGGLDSEGIGVSMTLSGCTIGGNQSVGGGGGDGITTGDSEADGGGIQAAAGTLNISGCTITNNQAIGGNNTILSDGWTIAGCAVGGGIENNFGNVLNISNSTIANNTAQGGSMTTNPGPGSDAMGGGISNSPSATMNMTNCVVSNNKAIAGHGGAGTNTSLTIAQGGLGFGGGVDTSRGSTATISSSVISGNSAIGGAGGTGNNGGNGYGGALGVGWGNLLGFGPDNAQLTVTNTVVIGNVAQGGAGGAGANGGNGLGGGLAMTAGATATVSTSLFTFNFADGGAKGSGGQNGLGDGGGVYYELAGGFEDDAYTFIGFNYASTSGNNIYLL